MFGFARWRKQTIWKHGEDAAAKHMKRAGCRILARNLRLKMGEIDLLCLEKSTNTIVIVEVKSRQHDPDAHRKIDPSANITRAKQTKLRTLARAIKQRPAYREMRIRIDVISIVFYPGACPADLKHLQSAIEGV